VNVEDLRYLEALRGFWEIGYPGPDGTINLSYFERLELRADLTYTWDPSPIWARKIGRWGVLTDPDTKTHKLYLENRRGELRGHWLVITTFRDAAPDVRFIHWQRTVNHGVVFSDRILAGRWLGNTPPQGNRTPRDRYPYLVIRVFSAFYQREAVEFRIGKPAVNVENSHCYVQHPTPFSADGRMSSDCRALLIAGVQAAVRSLKFRICIVWTSGSCTYVEADAVFDASKAPSGGEQSVTLEFAPQYYDPAGC